MIFTELVECCPSCGDENSFKNHDIATNGYVVKCQSCGEEMMLCDACQHADDNPVRKCDWMAVNRRMLDGHRGICFRGITHHKDAWGY